MQYLTTPIFGKVILYSIISIFAYFTARYIVPKQSVFWKDVGFVGITTSTIIYLINRIIGISTSEFLSTPILFTFGLIAFLISIIFSFIPILIVAFLLHLLRMSWS